jgi:hypothetical protein
MALENIPVTQIAGLLMVAVFIYMIYMKFTAKQKRKDVIEMAKAQKEAEKIMKQ